MYAKVHYICYFSFKMLFRHISIYCPYWCIFLYIIMSYSNRFIILIFNPKVTNVHGAMLEIFQTNIVYKEVIHLGFWLEPCRTMLSQCLVIAFQHLNELGSLTYPVPLNLGKPGDGYGQMNRNQLRPFLWKLAWSNERYRPRVA